MRRRAATVALLVIALVLAGCAVPLDESASPIPDEELPDTLRGTTTTTTAPPTGGDEVTITYFLVATPEGQPKKLEPAPREVEPATIREYLERVFAEGFRTESEAETLVNALENWTLISFTREGSDATIDIAPLDVETSRQLVLDTAAQLVYFLAEFGIERLQLMINGEDESLPTGDADTEPGDFITTDLYPLYAFDRVLPDPTTTTTESTTTTTAAPTTLPPSEE